MQQPHHQHRPADDLDVRLRWPGGDDPRRAPDGPGRRTTDDEPAPDGAASERTWAYDPPTIDAPDEVGTPVVDGLRLGRLVVDGLDRLASLLLERFRVLREEVDTDLSDVRNQVAGLRAAVEEASDRRPLRDVRDAVAELADDVGGLRAAVLEWPDLEQLTADVAALRADLATLTGAPVPPPGRRTVVAPAELDELRQQMGAVQRSLTEGPGVGALAPLIEAVGELRTQVAELDARVAALRDDTSAVRRRVALRAQGEAPALTDDQIDQVVTALTERILGSIGAED